MATNPIPVGTVNMTFNVPERLRHEIGRRAFEEDCSAGQLIRQAVAEYLSKARQAAPAVAGKVAVVLFGIGFGAAMWAAMAGGNDMRLSGRVVRTAKRWEEVA